MSTALVLGMSTEIRVPKDLCTALIPGFPTEIWFQGSIHCPQKRPSANTDVQIFNFIAQRDNALNINIAQSSHKIAEESRRDNLLNIEIAKATAQVAEETRQDSAAMKTIAVLGLTFLPGTAVAVSALAHPACCVSVAD